MFGEANQSQTHGHSLMESIPHRLRLSQPEERRADVTCYLNKFFTRQSTRKPYGVIAARHSRRPEPLRRPSESDDELIRPWRPDRAAPAAARRQCRPGHYTGLSAWIATAAHITHNSVQLSIEHFETEENIY